MALATGGDHHCAITADATLACWGRNWFGQAAPPEGAFRDVAVGLEHSCGIRPNQTIECWGSDEEGQMAAPEASFQAIAAGHWHTCGLLLDESISCWGSPLQAGRSTIAGSFKAIDTDVRTCAIRTDAALVCFDGDATWVAPEGGFSDVAVASGTVCGHRDEGTIACWNDDGSVSTTTPPGGFLMIHGGFRGMCGIRDDDSVLCWDAYQPAYVPVVGGFTAVSVGHAIACGIAIGGSVRCWEPSGAVETLVPPPTRRFRALSGDLACGIEIDTTISCGYQLSGISSPPSGSFTHLVGVGYNTYYCALRSDRQLRCWGTGSAAASAPVGEFASITTGWAGACGLRTDATVVCWRPHSMAVTTLPGTFTAISGGGLTVCGVQVNGTLACWDQTLTSSSAPPGTFRSLSVGYGGACAVRTDGTATCWGGNLADPVGSYLSVGAAGDHACGIRTDATVACWGDNNMGQTDPPVGSFQKVWAGSFTSCGIRTDGVLQCWGGYASTGELGPSSTSDAPGFHPVPPSRLLDTRPGPGQVGLAGRFGPAQARKLRVAGRAGIPQDATAVVLNVTAVDPSESTFLALTPNPIGPGDAPGTSNLNVPAGDVRPNLVVVKLDANGAVTVFNNSGTVDVLADVVGWFDDGAGFGDRQVAVAPTRILDTRDGPDQVGMVGPFGAAQTRVLPVVGHGGVPQGATAVVMNVTAVNPSANSFLSVVPTIPSGQVPATSNLNLVAGEVRPNLVVATLDGQGQVTIYNNSGSVDVLADVVGYFAPSVDDGPDGAVHTLPPMRILDTRPGPDQTGLAGPFGPAQGRVLTVAGRSGVPQGATAAWLNVTAVGPTQATFVSLTPDTLDPGEVPSTSNLNLVAGQVAPNLVLVELGTGGQVTIFNNSGLVHVLADVVAYVR